MSVRLSVCVRMQQLGFHWADFHEIFIFEYFSKICREIKIMFTVHEDRYTFLITSRSHFSLPTHALIN